MKWLILLIIVVGVLVAFGVIAFHKTPGKVEVDINTARLGQETHQGIQEGKKILHEVEKEAGASHKAEQAPSKPAGSGDQASPRPTSGLAIPAQPAASPAG